MPCLPSSLSFVAPSLYSHGKIPSTWEVHQDQPLPLLPAQSYRLLVSQQAPSGKLAAGPPKEGMTLGGAGSVLKGCGPRAPLPTQNFLPVDTPP